MRTDRVDQGSVAAAMGSDGGGGSGSGLLWGRLQYLFHLKLKTTCSTPLTNLATLLFKVLRLSQTSLELSSPKVVFGSQENERKKRDKREKL